MLHRSNVTPKQVSEKGSGVLDVVELIGGLRIIEFPCKTYSHVKDGEYHPEETKDSVELFKQVSFIRPKMITIGQSVSLFNNAAPESPKTVANGKP